MSQTPAYSTALPLIDKEGPAPSASSPQRAGTLRRMIPVVKYLRTNLDRRLSIKEIAQTSRLSASMLSHLFKHAFGVSPIQYHKQLKFQTAAQLLLENLALAVKEVLPLVEYKDQSSFTRDFKDMYGLPPLEYREACLRDGLRAGAVIKKAGLTKR